MVWNLSRVIEDFEAGCDDVRLLQRLGILRRAYQELAYAESPARDYGDGSEMEDGLTIGGKHFTDYDELRRYLNTERLRPLPVGVPVPADLHRLLAELFTYHPNFEEKMNGCHLKGFMVGEVDATVGGRGHGRGRGRGPAYMQKCYFFIRSDGTTDNFSVNKSIEGLKGVSAEQLHKYLVVRVLASSVIPAMDGFKYDFLRQHPQAICTYTAMPSSAMYGGSGVYNDSDGSDNENDDYEDDEYHAQPVGLGGMHRADQAGSRKAAASVPLSQMEKSRVVAVHKSPQMLSKLIAQWVQLQGGFDAVRLGPSLTTVHKELQDPGQARAWLSWWASHRGPLLVVSKEGYTAFVAQQALAGASIW